MFLSPLKVVQQEIPIYTFYRTTIVNKYWFYHHAEFSYYGHWQNKGTSGYHMKGTYCPKFPTQAKAAILCTKHTFFASIIKRVKSFSCCSMQ